MRRTNGDTVATVGGRVTIRNSHRRHQRFPLFAAVISASVTIAMVSAGAVHAQTATQTATATRTATATATNTQSCAGASLNCSAGDTSVTEIKALNVTKQCTGIGDTATVQFQMSVQTTAQTRNGLGLFIALDGGDAQQPSGSCYHGILTPLLPQGQTPTAMELSNGAGPYFNDDGDACGDLQKTDPASVFTVPTPLNGLVR